MVKLTHECMNKGLRLKFFKYPMEQLSVKVLLSVYDNNYYDMKAKIIKYIALAFFITGCYTYRQPLAAQYPVVNFQVFYDQLSPYGQWVDYPEYGYVWLPDAGPDFFPYLSDGYWLMSDFGWTWFSDYPWGSAPFHYGRWDYDLSLGWFWVPGDVWGPSWVMWRRTDGFYGWTPMRPGISVDIGLTGEIRDADRWIFVRDRDLTYHNLSRRSSPTEENDRLLRNSTLITNTASDQRRSATYFAGPKPAEVERITGRRINSVIVSDAEQPGSRLDRERLSIYRPRIETTAGNRTAPAPSRITDIKEIRPPRERFESGTNPGSAAARRRGEEPQVSNRPAEGNRGEVKPAEKRGKEPQMRQGTERQNKGESARNADNRSERRNNSSGSNERGRRRRE